MGAYKGRVLEKSTELRAEEERESNEVESSPYVSILFHTQMTIIAIFSFSDLLRTYYMLSNDVGTKNSLMTSTDTILALMEFAI